MPGRQDGNKDEQDAATGELRAQETIVVVGASAGGIEAVSTLLGSLPTNFPAPVVIAQHIDPRRPSHLAEILGRRSALPVRTVQDHAALESGVAYVVPADRHVTIDDHTLGLDPDTYGRPKPSVDVLFSSAAHAFGEGTIAVILSGSGSDGADGARMVKEAGGAVLVQDPATASYPSMPAALAPSTVDLVAPLERLGAMLAALVVQAPPVPAPTLDDERALRAILERVRERSCIDFARYKTPTIQRRLQRRVVATGHAALADYARYLQTHPEEYEKLVTSFLIKMTRFFRDPEVFERLRAQILPELMAGMPARGGELRLWSAGCATGEEAYTLAILVAETLGDALDTTRVRIFATDLDAAAIAFARRGIYPTSALAEVPPAIVARYFLALDGSYEVTKRIRGLVVFGEHDLAERAPFPRIDLCLCRNVLIYFTAALQRRALELFALALRDGGYLVLGKSESTSPLPDFFAADDPRLKIYRRGGERVLLPPTSIARAVPPGPAAVSGVMAPPARVPAGLEHGGARGGVERLRNILMAAPLAVVIVDRRYDIVDINPAARRLLDIHGAAVGDDLLHLMPPPVSAVLRPLIDAVLARETPAPVVATLPGALAADAALDVQITCYRPAGDGRDDGQVAVRGRAAAVLVLSDITPVAARGRALERVAAEAGQRVVALEAALNAERENAAADRERLRGLLRANDELATSNEALREENEALLIGNEEAQASTEEVETLNEELQATNEELQTLNEELQATVEELNTTNDDLQLRNVETGELANRLAAQRAASEQRGAALAARLLTLDDAVVVVNATSEPVLGNAAYLRLTGGIDAPLVLTDAEGNALAPEATPQRRVSGGETVSMGVMLAGADGQSRRYIVTGEPLGAEDAPQGGVLVFRAHNET